MTCAYAPSGNFVACGKDLIICVLYNIQCDSFYRLEFVKCTYGQFLCTLSLRLNKNAIALYISDGPFCLCFFFEGCPVFVASGGLKCK